MINSKTIRLHFSFRSPFAGVALYRMRRLAIFNDYEIELIPTWPELVFGGHMDNPTDNLFKIAYVFKDAARQAEEAGLDTGFLMAMAENFKVPVGVDLKAKKLGIPMPTEDWAVAHHAFLYALDQGKGWAFADAVFDARFGFSGGNAKNVTDKAVLAEIAEQLELDADAVTSAAESGQYDARQTEFVRQGEEDGVFGVPFFVIESNAGKEVFWGNDRIATLQKALTGAAELPRITTKDLQTTQRD